MIFNPLNWLGGLGWQIKLIIIALVFVAGTATGWQVHGWKFQASEGQSINQAIKTSQTLNTQAEKIIQIKQKQESEAKIVYKTIYKEIAAKNDDRICFDAESLSLWNRSIIGADNNRTEPARATPENDAIVADVKEVLTNAADNFETCNSNAIKHNALIDKVESLKGKMCVCPE
ncbi:MAG: hypothetical protein WBC07_08610 [Methylotenera sp.]